MGAGRVEMIGEERGGEGMRTLHEALVWTPCPPCARTCSVPARVSCFRCWRHLGRSRVFTLAVSISELVRVTSAANRVASFCLLVSARVLASCWVGGVWGG